MAFARATGHRCRDTGADRLGRSDWWPKILGRWFSDDVQRAVVARGASGIEGYASFTFGSDEGPLDFEYSINCRHLVATSVEGWASLLSLPAGSEVSGER